MISHLKRILGASAVGNANAELVPAIPLTGPLAALAKFAEEPEPRPSAAPAPPARLAESPPSHRELLTVSFERILEHWPDALRFAWNGQSVADIQIQIPLARLQADLLEGRVSLTWEELAAMADSRLTAPAAVTAAYAGAEIPLAAVVPAFLEAAGLPAPAIPLPENVPDLFFSVDPQAVPAPKAEASTAEAIPPVPAADPEEVPVLAVPLAWLRRHWPENVCQTLAALDQSRIQFPVARIEPQLQQGRIEFSWRELAGWLVPPLTSPLGLRDDVRIEIPPAALARTYFRWLKSGQSLAVVIPVKPVSKGRVAPAPAFQLKANITVPAEAPSRNPGYSRSTSVGELAVRLREAPGVESVFVVNERGQFVTGRLPAGLDRAAVAATVTRLHKQVAESLGTFGGPVPQPFVLGCGPWTLAVCQWKKQMVVAVARSSNQPPVELWRLIREAESEGL